MSCPLAIFRAAVAAVQGRTIMRRVLKVDDCQLTVSAPGGGQKVTYDLSNAGVYVLGAGQERAFKRVV